MEESMMMFGTTWLLFALVIPVVVFALWVWALVDILRSDFSDVVVKIVWFLLVFFVPLLGFILYVILGKSTKISQNRSDSHQKYDALKRIKQLYDSGALSEAEFETEKQKIMSQMQ